MTDATAAATEPILALTGAETGTVAVNTDQGSETALILRLHGRDNGQGPPTSWRITIRPDEIAQFLDVVNNSARQLFPNHVPAEQQRRGRSVKAKR